MQGAGVCVTWVAGIKKCTVLLILKEIKKIFLLQLKQLSTIQTGVHLLPWLHYMMEKSVT